MKSLKVLLLFLYQLLFVVGNANAQSEIYYADPSTNTINRANIDGDSVTTILASGITNPFSLDHALNTVCWGDFGNGEVNCIDDDGTNPRNIVTLLFSVPILSLIHI